MKKRELTVEFAQRYRTEKSTAALEVHLRPGILDVTPQPTRVRVYGAGPSFKDMPGTRSVVPWYELRASDIQRMLAKQPFPVRLLDGTTRMMVRAHGRGAEATRGFDIILSVEDLRHASVLLDQAASEGATLDGGLDGSVEAPMIGSSSWEPTGDEFLMFDEVIIEHGDRPFRLEAIKPRTQPGKAQVAIRPASLRAKTQPEAWAELLEIRFHIVEGDWGTQHGKDLVGLVRSGDVLAALRRGEDAVPFFLGSPQAFLRSAVTNNLTARLARALLVFLNPLDRANFLVWLDSRLERGSVTVRGFGGLMDRLTRK